MHSMIHLPHWISRNTNLALFKKVCNMILLMASFCVCYKRHTSSSERRFCHSYSLDICWYGLQTASAALKLNQGCRQTSLSWEAATDDYLSKHSRATAADTLCCLATAVGFRNGIRGSVFWFQCLNFFIAWHGLLKFIWDTLIFAV